MIFANMENDKPWATYSNEGGEAREGLKRDVDVLHLAS